MMYCAVQTLVHCYPLLLCINTDIQESLRFCTVPVCVSALHRGTDALYTPHTALRYATTAATTLLHHSNGTATQQAAAVRAQQLTLSAAEGDCIAADRDVQEQNTAAFVSSSSNALAAMRNISLNATLAGSGIQGLAAANARFAPPASSGGYK
jgi:hypothetical protein